MLLNNSDTVSNELLSPQGLCSLIELEYHPSINTSLRKVEDYLISNAYGKELSIPISELIHLVFMKLADELQHFFLKESGIIFPAICKNEKAIQAKEPGQHQLQNALLETVQQRQQIIVNLLQKMRQLLHDYNIHSEWSIEWQVCVNEMFLLETKIYQWIHIEGSLLYPKLIKN
jgi:iron-sulfur cluster repair protein YtfE (RIC family)